MKDKKRRKIAKELAQLMYEKSLDLGIMYERNGDFQMVLETEDVEEIIYDYLNEINI